MQHSIQSGGPRYARRSKTVSVRQLRAEKKNQVLVIHYPDDIERPKRRRDCVADIKLCPHCGTKVKMRIFHVTVDRFRRQEIWEAIGNPPIWICKIWRGDGTDMVDPLRLRQRKNYNRPQSSSRPFKELWMYQHQTSNVRDPRIQRLAIDDTTMRKFENEEISIIWRSGYPGLREMAGELQGVSSRHGPSAEFQTQLGSYQQRWELRAKQLPLGNVETTKQKQAVIACPECTGPVRYVGGMGGSKWAWTHYNSREVAEGLERRASGVYPSWREMNHCRPCIWTACRYNLYLDVLPHGAIKFNFPNLEPFEMIESCALDVAEMGPHTLEEVGDILQVSRERIRQIWEIIRNKLIDNGVILRLANEYDIKKKAA